MNETIKALLDEGKITQDEYDILFCSKDAWFTTNEEGQQDWSLSNDKQIEFWRTIKKVKEFFENIPENIQIPISYNFSFIQFPKILIVDDNIVSPDELLPKFLDKNLLIIFDEATFYGDITIINCNFNIDLNFRKCIFKDNFSLIDCAIKSIDFSNTIFKKKTTIRKSIFNAGTKFNNATFHDELKLEELHFNDHVNLTITSIKKSIFNDLTFEKIASFGDAVFADSVSFNHCNFNNFTDFTKTGFNDKVYFSKVFFHDVYFIETIFLSKVTFIFLKADYFIMRSSIIKNLTINNSFIKNSDIDRLFSTTKTQDKHQPVSLSKKHISDRQTARFLKNLYDNQKNIPNSNQLFAIEQDYFIDEIKNKNILEVNKIPTLATLYLNKYVSNFGTSWLRVLGWIIFLSLLVLFFHDGTPHNIEDFINIPNRAIELINPLNVFKKDYTLYEGHEFWAMIVRIVTVYLFYQFAMAFRQNTRRK